MPTEEGSLPVLLHEIDLLGKDIGGGVKIYMLEMNEPYTQRRPKMQDLCTSGLNER